MECMCKDRKPGLRSEVYGTVNQAFFLVVKRVCASGLRSGVTPAHPFQLPRSF